MVAHAPRSSWSAPPLHVPMVLPSSNEAGLPDPRVVNNQRRVLFYYYSLKSPHRVGFDSNRTGHLARTKEPHPMKYLAGVAFMGLAIATQVRASTITHRAYYDGGKVPP